MSDIADGMVWAAGGAVAGVPANPTPARVINLSLGGSGACSTTFQPALTTVRSLGAVVVVAAGNSAGDANASMPANCQGVAAAAAAPAPSLTALAEVEPNNTGSTAQVVNLPNVRISGSLSARSDVDFYRVSLPVGKTLTAQLTPNAAPAFGVTVYTASGSSLAASGMAGNGAVGTVVYSNTGSATSAYLVGVARCGGATGSYSLKLTQCRAGAESAGRPSLRSRVRGPVAGCGVARAPQSWLRGPAAAPEHRR